MRRILLLANIIVLVVTLAQTPAMIVSATTSAVRIIGTVFSLPYRGTAIAHALGRVDGYDYTNSREAFERSYRLGFRVFEVDLMVTGDGQIVAAHNAGPMRDEFGRSERVADMTAAAFVTQRYYERYQPLAFTDLLDLLEQYPNASLILDAKDRPDNDQATFAAMHDAMAKQIRDRDPALFARIVPYVYEQDQIDAVAAYPSVIYAIYRVQVTPEAIVRFVEAHPSIQTVAFERRQFSVSLTHELHQQNVQSFVHTLNDADEARAFLYLGADGIVTDILHP